MPQVYIHLQDEASNIILEKYGIIHGKDEEEQSSLLKSTYCPNCNEPNKQDSRFCSKCRMILSYDSYIDTVENQKQKDEQINQLITKQEKFEQLIHSLIESGQLKPQPST